MVTGNTLLDFAPARHRTLLENLASQQSGLGAVFTGNCVAEAYASDGRDIQWERFTDPWAFYTPESIAARQQRWLEEGENSKKNNMLKCVPCCICGQRNAIIC